MCSSNSSMHNLVFLAVPFKRSVVLSWTPILLDAFHLVYSITEGSGGGNNFTAFMNSAFLMGYPSADTVCQWE